MAGSTTRLQMKQGSGRSRGCMKQADEGQGIMHRAEKIAGQVDIKGELLEQGIQDLLVRPAPPAPPRVDGA